MSNRELARAQQPTSHSSSLPTSLSERLAPASAKAGTAELMACLTLVAPSGMTAEDRRAWVAVARQTLTGIPADLLAMGCKQAREKCRFASEIVPTILETVKPTWDGRKRFAAIEQARELNRNAPKIEHNPDYVGPEQLRELLSSLRSSLGA